MKFSDLIEYGFQEISAPLHKHGMRAWEYQFRDGKGICFFVRAYFLRIMDWENFEFEAQFNAKGQTFEVSLFGDKEQTAEFVVNWFWHMWLVMGCDYYNRERS